jgi:hypothetical protein
MKRRHFLQGAGMVSASFALRKPERLFAQHARFGSWRTFEVTTHVEVLKPSGPTRVWVPTPLITDTLYQKTLASSFQSEGGSVTRFENKADALGLIAAQFPTGVRP